MHQLVVLRLGVWLGLEFLSVVVMTLRCNSLLVCICSHALSGEKLKYVHIGAKKIVNEVVVAQVVEQWHSVRAGQV